MEGTYQSMGKERRADFSKISQSLFRERAVSFLTKFLERMRADRMREKKKNRYWKAGGGGGRGAR